MNDPKDHATIDALVDEFAAITPKSGSVEAVYETSANTNKLAGLLQLVFSVIIAIMMFLCFFSLSASMTSNLYE